MKNNNNNSTRLKVKELNLKDPFWALRDLVSNASDDDLYNVYLSFNLFKNEQEKINAENYLAETILLDSKEST